MPYKIYLTPSARDRSADTAPGFIIASSWEDVGNSVYKFFLVTEGLANEKPSAFKFLHIREDIDKIEPFEYPSIEAEEVESSGDCFIATACEADPDTLQTLRRFRDEVLRESEIGKKFIAAYYKTGPQVARLIQRKTFLKKAILIGLILPLKDLVKNNVLK